MRPLFITPDVVTAIERVKAYADAHRFSLHDICHLMGHPEKAPGHTPGFVVEIPRGFRCCFTIEQQPDGWMRHLSISVMMKERVPTEAAVMTLLPLFGFKRPLRECVVHLMQESVASINVLELLE